MFFYMFRDWYEVGFHHKFDSGRLSFFLITPVTEQIRLYCFYASLAGVIRLPQEDRHDKKIMEYNLKISKMRREGMGKILEKKKYERDNWFRIKYIKEPNPFKNMSAWLKFNVK